MREFFTKLYGNGAAKNRIGRAIESSTLPHAFLIVGPDGSGKKTLALEIAAAVNCRERGNRSINLPCHACNSCKRIFSGEFTDVKELSRKSDKQTIGVEQVRDFREDMFLSSTESEYKIYIINEAERMTPNAQNALLKVLEEPPSGVIIILLSSTDDGILTTIKSRTQHVSMQRFEAGEIFEYLSKTGKISPLSDKIKTLELLMSADGRIGRAAELLGDGAAEAEEKRRVTENIVLALRKNTPYSTLLSAIKEIPTKKDEFAATLESIICAIRDLILLKNAQNAPLVFYSDRNAATALAEQFNTKRLMSAYDLLCDALLDNSRNVSTASLIAVIGAKIKFI